MYHPIGSWDSKEHLLQSVGILTERIKAMKRKFPTWNTAQQLKGRPMPCALFKWAANETTESNCAPGSQEASPVGWLGGSPSQEGLSIL
jgi:hypothetical protein